jgi:hypothetical protein
MNNPNTTTFDRNAATTIDGFRGRKHVVTLEGAGLQESANCAIDFATTIHRSIDPLQSALLQSKAARRVAAKRLRHHGDVNVATLGKSGRVVASVNVTAEG